MASTSDWTCPYCDRDTTITDSNVASGFETFNQGNEYQSAVGLFWLAVVCPNPKCKKIELTASLYKARYDHGAGKSVADGPTLARWQLAPASHAKVFPAYIPEVLRRDYEEACAIRDLSPKASATLSRRCLQGIIRDFWKIKKNRLIDEINELKGKIDESTWEAIDGVRSIGNIGAHMEKDIDVIVDVDPDEAQLLIQLIETLFRDCYIARYGREQHLAKIKAVAQAKKEQQKASASKPAG
jgi:hypothetical protein